MTAFDVVGADWDATVPNAASRTVFTAVSVAGVMTQVAFDSAHVSQLYGPMGMTSANASTATTHTPVSGPHRMRSRQALARFTSWYSSTTIFLKRL